MSYKHLLHMLNPTISLVFNFSHPTISTKAKMSQSLSREQEMFASRTRALQKKSNPVLYFVTKSHIY
jgi:hypothetical protein